MKQFLLMAMVLIAFGNVNAQPEKNQPNVYLNYSISKQAKGHDKRNQSNDEIFINLFINDSMADTFTDFGSGEYSKEEMTLYLQSDISQKTYAIKIINESQVTVSLFIFFNGEEREIWKKTYSTNGVQKWSKTKCEGDCE